MTFKLLTFVVCPSLTAGTKLGHNLSAALLAQLASGDFLWCTALRRRGFNPADSVHCLVRTASCCPHTACTFN